MPTPPIEVAAPRRSGGRRALRWLRRAAGWAHLVLALVIVAGVFLQVYLIGAYVFGAGPGALHAHESVGFTVHGLEVLVLLVALVAWLPGADLVLSLLLAVVGTVQIALAGSERWVGGLHPLLALVVLGLAVALLQRNRPLRRRGSATLGA